MAKMVAMPIYGKSPSEIFSGTSGPICTKRGTCMFHWKLWPIIVCTNYDPWLTLTYFMARTNFVTYAFLYEKSENSGSFKNIAACDLKVVRCRQLIELMKICAYSKSK